METTPTAPQLPDGHIFTRELHGTTLLLNSQTNLGSLHEPEIAHEAEDLLHLINESQSTNVVIDLSRAEYLGTAMLGAVVKLWKRISLRGGHLALCNVSENVAQVLRITKLNAVWPIYASRDQAMTAIGG